MKSFRQLDRPSELFKLVDRRRRIALSVACLAAVAAASPTSGAEIILIASTPKPTAHYASSEQKVATQHFDIYDAAARRELEQVASYPNKSAAVNQRLEGKVGVAFEINSSGDLQHAEVVQSSRSKILDSAALASVRWAKYPAFASGNPTGQLSRRYTVIFDYRFASED